MTSVQKIKEEKKGREMEIKNVKRKSGFAPEKTGASEKKRGYFCGNKKKVVLRIRFEKNVWHRHA